MMTIQTRKRYRLSTESLEERQLLAITSAFDTSTGHVSIEIDADDDVVIADPGTTLEVNGQDIGSGVGFSQVKSIEVVAVGDFPNRIDLAFEQASFPNLESVTVDSGGGDDHIEASNTTDVVITTGDGNDSIGMSQFNDLDAELEPVHFVVNGDTEVILDKEFAWPANSQFEFFGDSISVLQPFPADPNSVFVELRAGSSFVAHAGQLHWEGFHLVMQPSALVSSTTGNIGIGAAMLTMFDRAKITSDSGDINVILRTGYEQQIAHLGTGGAVMLDVGFFSNVFDAGDTDLDIVASRFELDNGARQEQSDDFLEIDVDILEPNTFLALTNIGDLTVRGRGYTGSVLIAAVPNVDTAERGNVSMTGSFNGRTLADDVTIKAANDIDFAGVSFGDGVSYIHRLTLQFGGDLRTDQGIYRGVELRVEPTGEGVSRSILLGAMTFVAPSGIPGFTQGLWVNGGNADDHITINTATFGADSSSENPFPVTLDAGGGSDSYELHINPAETIASLRPVLLVSLLDSGPASDRDTLFVTSKGSPITTNGNELSYTKENGGIVTINFEGIEVLTIQEVNGDADLDGNLDSNDIDTIYAAIASNDNSFRYDVDSDATVDIDDVNFFVATVLDTAFGDVDLDGDVQFDDFLRLSANFGREGADIGWSEGDQDGNGAVDFADFLKLSDNYGP